MSTNALPPGTILDRNLEVKRVLGEGGFGITYLVHDHDLQQDLVLKEFFPPAWARRVGKEVVPIDQTEARQDFSHFLKRFLDEARVAARVDHPNMVKVLRFFPANGTGYFAMAWQEGETLDGVLKRQGVMTPAAAMRLIEPLLDALEQLHAAGLIHRDIKPGNIYVRKDGSPLLLDFGSARAPASRSGSAPLTTVLSPGYAPFEQYTLDGIQGPHTDIYAVGAVLYRMLTGKEPLDALTRFDTATQRRHSPCVEAAPPSVPVALSRVVDQAMAMEITQRIADAPRLRRELREALMGHPGESTQPRNPEAPTPPNPDPRKPERLALVAAALVVAAGIATTPIWWPAKPPVLTDTTTDGDSSVTTPPPVQQPIDAISPQPILEAPPVDAGTVITTTSPDVTPLLPTEDLVQQVRAGLPPGDLSVTVALDPPNPKFVEGEFLSIGFSTKEDAYAAVFVYSQDGSVTMLYPNDYAKGKIVKANQMTWVGATDQKFRLQVAPPFGTDIIHVVAFRNPDDFKLLLDMLDINKATKELFVVDRSSFTRSVATMRTRGIKVVAAPVPAQAGAPIKQGWGDAVSNLTTVAR